MRSQNTSGFTLVEIMIVVAIIAILAAVAIPNFMNYRNTAHMNACISNMKQIQSAAEQIKLAGKTVDDSTLYGKDGYIKVKPTCPIDHADYEVAEDDSGEITVTCPNATKDAKFKHILPDTIGEQEGE